MRKLTNIEKFERFGSVLGLERIKQLMQRLSNPEKSLKCIHIAGTNGKGSVARYIYETLEEAGYNTGIFISPFLEKFNERIESNHQYITDDELERISEKVVAEADKMVEEGFESPTEFEIITAIAFLYFKEKQVDYVVLETGLGGRGDSTNLIEKPVVSVITSISFDHTDRLGDTIEKIAWEKAGIIKDGCPVVCGAKDKKASEVIKEEAASHKSPYKDVSSVPVIFSGNSYNKQTFEANGRTIEISMMGKHQVDNAVTALVAVDQLKCQGAKIDEEAIKKGFLKARQPGRFERVSEEPLIILDGAHNEAGTVALARTVGELFKEKKILLITGVLADKNVDAMAKNFVSIAEDIIVTEPDNPRKLSGEKYKEILKSKGGNVISLMTPMEAADFAKTNKKYDLVIFAGSIYLIGEIRRRIVNG